ncbi:CBS domain-containing protein [Salinarimonas rosea]|uniref:CBS domain-containing protein n=1 Tax=Salinarimonas rosea TaxID=552063 RepID=UPI00042260D3|nr:CBS domain-containing protein [Salinarimonas rosea]
MKVSDVMTRGAALASPTDTIAAVAKRMADDDLGFLPVGDDARMVGMITDRDIVVRAVAQGRDPNSVKVSEVMTTDVRYCFEDEDLDHVVQNMGNLQVRRLPVVDRDKKLVGVVSLADSARDHDTEAAGIAMSGVTQPGGPHTQ